MSFEIHVDEATQIAFMVIRGEARLPELVKAIAAIAPQGTYISNKRLWDLREMTGSVTPEELELLARAALTRDTLKPSRVGIVADQELTFRLSQLFETYRGTAEVGVRAFKSDEEAISWLEELD